MTRHLPTLGPLGRRIDTSQAPKVSLPGIYEASNSLPDADIVVVGWILEIFPYMPLPFDFPRLAELPWKLVVWDTVAAVPVASLLGRSKPTPTFLRKRLIVQRYIAECGGHRIWTGSHERLQALHVIIDTRSISS